jgi:hypothetical protein
MFNIEFLAEYMVPVIVGICLLFGFIVKKWIKDVDNKWIPTIVAVVGVAAAAVLNKEISIAVIVGGALSGLSSTGLHQLFKQWLDNGGE